MTTITWNNRNGGNWNTALDWTPNQVPGSGDDALINASGIYTVTITSNVAVNNLTTVAGATVAVSNGDALTLNTGSTITNDGTIALNSTGNATKISLTGAIGGTITLDGGGALVLGNNANNTIEADQFSLTLNNNSTIEGSGSVGTNVNLNLNNSGTIDADQSTPLILQPSLNNSSPTTNTGTLEATNGGTLQLEGIITNTGGLIQATGTNSVVSLTNGVSATDGTLTSSNGGIIRSVNGTLSGSPTITTGSTVSVPNGDSLTFATGSTITNNGTITLDSTGNTTKISLNGTNGGTITLDGSGVLVLGNNANNTIEADQFSLTLNNNSTIEGSGGIGTNVNLNLNNTGTIDANQSSPLILQPSLNNSSPTTNTGTLEATNGGTLQLEGIITNTGGLIQASGTNSMVSLTNGVSVTGGSLLATGTGATISLVNATIAGATLGGTIVSTAGATSVLNGVTISSGSTYTGIDNSQTIIEGTITNNGTIALDATGDSTNLQMLAGQTVTLNGGGTVNLSNQGTNNITVNAGTGNFINVDNTITGSGLISGVTLDNQAMGTIDANQSTPLTLDPGNGFFGVNDTNEGLIEATNGATVTLGPHGSFTQSSTGTLLATGAGSTVLLDTGVITNNGLFEASNGGLLDVTNAIADGGLGHLEITAGSEIELGGATSERTNFVGANAGTLNLIAPSSYTGEIVGFFVGDTLELAGTHAISAVPTGIVGNDTILTVTLSGGSKLTYDLFGDYGTDTFTTNFTGGNSFITVTPANIAPVLGGAGNTVSYIQSGPPVVVDGALTVRDPDEFIMTGAMVTITGGFLPGDVLNADPTGTAITPSYDPATGVLTLTGLDTTNDYQHVLDFLTFSSSSNDPTNGGTDPSRTISWTISNYAATSAVVTSTIDVKPQLSGQISLAAATEGVALPATTTVASFTDTNTGDTAATLTAAINWGDGTTTSGTVSGSNGAFTVTGGHSYADEGSELLGVTITDTANSTTLPLSGTVTVAEGDVLTPHGLTFTANPGQAFTGTVATFTDSDTANVAGDFTATINWGDGTTTAGVITDTAGTIAVSGTHTYAGSGQDAVSVTLTDDAPGTATATASSTANVGAQLSGQISLAAATEGVALPATTTVASFTDTNTGDTAATLTAAINWGDGTTTSGTVSGSNGAFTVTGGHSYADEGSELLGVTITDTANSTTLPLSGTVTVAEGDVLTPHGLTFTANPGQAFTGTVATFTDSDTANVAGDFTATINWGDGTTTAGVITDTAGTIAVSGTHTYAGSGQDAVSVTLTDDAPGTATATASSTANVGAQLSGQISLAAATEGVALPATTTVASFTDTNTGDTAATLTAAINWGDGTTTSGTVSGSNGAFTVTGGHSYADEGSELLGVTITDTANSTTLPLSGTVTVAEGDVLTPHGLTFTANPGQAFTGTVATFTDSDTANVAGDFTATINWGDGTTTAGVITDTAGTIAVSGTHTYAGSGQDAVSVTLTDDAPGTATATASSTANVGAQLSGQISLAAATEGVALPATTTVASFTDTNTGDTAATLTAAINWGDGTTTSGTVSGSNGAFTVTGGHSYADEGSELLGVTITDTANSTTLPLSGTVTVAEGDVLTPHGLTFTANPGQAFTGTVATFTDSDTANVAGDFTATINWGDGTTTAGVITDTAGTIAVSGTHTYAGSGQDAVSVTLTDDAPGTATATASSTANVGAQLSGQISLAAATEGVALPATTTVASFTDTNTGDTAATLTAAINWGDGTITTGTVSGSNGAFTVTGGHSYADEGSELLGVTITDTANSTTLPLSGTVTVAEGDVLTPHGLTFTANPGQAFTGTVATFTDSDTANVAGDFTATINWGDGTTTAGVITDTAGTIAVSGTHTYAGSGQDAVSVTLTDDAPGTATATASSTANVGATDHPPVITSDGGGSTASIFIDHGKYVATVHATDSDPGTTIKYSIVGGSDQKLFSVDPKSGVLSFKSKPLAGHDYQVTVAASDGTLQDTQSIKVQVANAPFEFGNTGVADTFVFKPHFGLAIVSNFDTASPAYDVLDLDHNLFRGVSVNTSPADVLALVEHHSFQVGHDLVVVTDTHDVIDLINTNLNNLSAHNFTLI